jgi:hypothetical protein
VNAEKLRENTITALRASGAPPEIVYAYERTGMLVVAGLRAVWSAADLDEWDDAIPEYREQHANSQRCPHRRDPHQDQTPLHAS